MEKKQLNKKKILGLCIIALVIIVLVGIIFGKRDDRKEKEKNMQEQIEANKNYQVLESGIELNTSPKILETKTFEELQINNIQITRNNGITTLIADVYNPTNSIKGGFSADIKFLEEDGDEISTMVCYIDEIPSYGSKEIIVSSTYNLIDCYELEFVKK